MCAIPTILSESCSDLFVIFQAARKGQEHIVELLRQAGANLGGADIEGGYADLELAKAKQTNDNVTLAIWKRAGFEH